MTTTLGRRTKKTLYDTTSVRYYHDGVHEIEEYDGSGNVLRKYIYREDIDSIAMMEAKDVADLDNDANTTELVRIFYHYDPRSNVARLTAAAQTVVESYEYDPYGNASIKDKTGGGVGSTQVGNPFDFQRRRRDVETWLLYFRARHYDPVQGHWIQRDPLQHGESCNLHEFVRSNPLEFVDPSGTQEHHEARNYAMTGSLQSPSLYHESVRASLLPYGLGDTLLDFPPNTRHRVYDDNGKESSVPTSSWWSKETSDVICYDNPLNEGINYTLGAHTEEVKSPSKAAAEKAKAKAIENAKAEIDNRKCPSKCPLKVPLGEQWTVRSCTYVEAPGTRPGARFWVAVGMAQYKFQCLPRFLMPMYPPVFGHTTLPGFSGIGAGVPSGRKSSAAALEFWDRDGPQHGLPR